MMSLEQHAKVQAYMELLSEELVRLVTKRGPWSRGEHPGHLASDYDDRIREISEALATAANVSRMCP